MNMSKKTMWILSILGLGLMIPGLVAYVITIVSFITSSLATPDSPPAQPNIGGMFTGFGFAIAFLLAGGIIELIGRIGMLIRQAKQQQWIWFVCTLLLGWVCMIVYLFVWPETPQPLLSTPAYAPQYQPMPSYPPYQVMQQPPYYESQGREPYPPQG